MISVEAAPVGEESPTFDALLGLRVLLAQVREASTDVAPDAPLADDDPAVLLLLGARALERTLGRWFDAAEPSRDAPDDPGELRGRLLR